MKNLFSRVASALIAVLLLFVAIYYGRELGVYILCLFVVVRGSYEMARMLFNEHYPRFVKRLHVFLSTSIFLIITLENFHSIAGVAMIFSFVLVACLGILFHTRFKNLERVLTFVTKNCLGLIYTCFLPATVVWTVHTNNGIEWFLCLLTVVFAGDIGAYIFGVNFGKTKIAPLLSPNKSLQGAVGGLLFSTAASLVFSFFIPNTPVYVLVLVGCLGGFFGQIGDFFESLIKRVSGVKDSGSIMPGHGGVLDRLDGILLSAPLFYMAATYYSL
jgi:phosphatidate cytidylyltransferase